MSETDLADPPVTLDDIPREPTQDGPAVRLYLVDGSGYIFRAYHALPPLTRKSDGLPVGAVAGFCNMMWKFLCDMKDEADAPTHLAVIFDHSEKTFRNDLYDQYKAHRPPPPEDLVPVGDEARQVVAVAAGGERARHADQDHAPALEHVVGGARDRALGADHPEGGLGQVVADLDHRGSLVVARWDGAREQRA